MLFSLDRNKKMFPEKVMEAYGRPEHGNVQPLVPDVAVPKISTCEPNKALVL